MKFLTIILAMMMLTGCTSEVEKCVDTGMASMGIKSDLNNRIAAQVEQRERLKCMGYDQYKINSNAVNSSVMRLDTKTGELNYCYLDTDKRKVVCLTSE